MCGAVAVRLDMLSMAAWCSKRNKGIMVNLLWGTYMITTSTGFMAPLILLVILYSLVMAFFIFQLSSRANIWLPVTNSLHLVNDCAVVCISWCEVFVVVVGWP